MYLALTSSEPDANDQTVPVYYTSYAINVTYYCYRVLSHDCSLTYGSFGCYTWMRSRGELQDMGAYLAPFLDTEGQGEAEGEGEGPVEGPQDGGGGGPAALQGGGAGGGSRALLIGLLAGLLGGRPLAAHRRGCRRTRRHLCGGRGGAGVSGLHGGRAALSTIKARTCGCRRSSPVRCS